MGNDEDISDAVETDPLALTDGELKSIDQSIDIMKKLFVRRGCRVFSSHSDDTDAAILDNLISDTLKSLRNDVVDRPAEKVFDRIGRLCLLAEEKTDREILGTIYIRMIDTIDCIAAIRGTYRGCSIRRSKYSKDEAFSRLQAMGLTRR